MGNFSQKQSEATAVGGKRDNFLDIMNLQVYVK